MVANYAKINMVGGLKSDCSMMSFRAILTFFGAFRGLCSVSVAFSIKKPAYSNIYKISPP